LRFLTAAVSVDAPAGEKRGDFLPILHGFFKSEHRLGRRPPAIWAAAPSPA
jgi:hypothetical protein